jgi:hypothetical protein
MNELLGLVELLENQSVRIITRRCGASAYARGK